MKFNLGDKVRVKKDKKIGFIVNTGVSVKFQYRVFFTKGDERDIFNQEEILLVEEKNRSLVVCPEGLCVLIKTDGWLCKVVNSFGGVRHYGQKDCRVISKLERALK